MVGSRLGEQLSVDLNIARGQPDLSESSFAAAQQQIGGVVVDQSYVAASAGVVEAEEQSRSRY